MRDDGDLGFRHIVDALENLGAFAGHGDHGRGDTDQAIHDALLLVVRLFQNGVQGGDDRHGQAVEQVEQISARRPAINAELMLDEQDLGAVAI